MSRYPHALTIPALVAACTSSIIPMTLAASTAEAASSLVPFQMTTRTLTTTDLGKKVDIAATGISEQGAIDCSTVKISVPGGKDVRNWSTAGCYTGGVHLDTIVTADMFGKTLVLSGGDRLTVSSTRLNTTVSVGTEVTKRPLRIVQRKDVSGAAQPIATPTATPAPTPQPKAAPAVMAAPAPTATPTATASPSATVQVPAGSIVASPTGSGTACTLAQPCAIDGALAGARLKAPTATGDITIVLRGGTYSRTAPIPLTAADSGQNGHKIVWTTVAGEKPVIDGGRRVTGWTAWSGRPGVYRADVPKGTVGRQLYVGGKPADRSRATASEVLGATVLNSSLTGYNLEKAGMASWANLGDTEILWTGAAGGNVEWEAWVQRRCPVRSVVGTSLVVQQPCFAMADPKALQGVGRPTHVENNLAILDAPGEFYLDAAAGTVYYMPRAGESMSSVETVLPVAQGLVRGQGVANVTMKGLTFTHDTWMQPSSDSGYAEIQATWFGSGGGTFASAPGVVDFRTSHGITLDGVTVTNAGGAGISFEQNSSAVAVRNSNVRGIAGSGISLGGVQASVTGDKAMVVEGNSISHVGQQYLGGVGVFAGYISDSSISDNTVTDTSYSGISAGWGWGTKSSFGNNHIDRNRIERVMQSDLIDGGAIYVLGVGTSTSTISGNYIVDDPKPYGAIYLDGSSSLWEVTGNVVSKAKTNWMFLQDLPEQAARSNVVKDNETDTTQQRLGITGLNTSSGNVTGAAYWSARAQQTIAAAGR